MAHPDRLIRNAVRKRYLVTLEGDEALEGVLIDSDANHLVLADVGAMAADGARRPVDGQVWIPRARVRYLQTTA